MSKCSASCVVCKKTQCKLGCLGRVNTGQDASSEAGVPCRKSRTGAGDQGDDWEVSLALAGGVRGREREMQGPGDSDPGEEAAEATPYARSVSALRVGTDSKNLFIGQYDKLFEEYWLSPIS